MTEKSLFPSQHGAGGAGYQPQKSPADTSPTRGSKPEAAFDQALVFHQAGRVSEAEQMYRQILKDQPNHVDALHLLGVIDHQRGNHAEAVRHIDAALAINPMLASAFYTRGNALFRLRQFGEAVASYDQAIALKPDSAETYSNRGLALCELKRFDEGLASYDRAIALKPDCAEAFINRGNTLCELKRFDEALASCNRAIALNPASVEAFNNRGNAFTALKQFEAAVASYNQAIALKPNHAAAFYNRGNALQELRRIEDALASYNQAIALKPDYADAFNSRGAALADLGHYDEAVASYNQAIALRPDYADAFNNRGYALQALKRLDEALASYTQAVLLAPNNVISRHMLAACISDPHCERAPEVYVRKFFDHYAPHFDESLTRLQYRAPQLIAERLTRSVTPSGDLEVLDAGCGTGLCGPLLKPFAARLVGVDLSVGMLVEAAKRELYDELVEAELGAYLTAHPSSFNIIVCCDTLVYLGRLEDTVAAAATALKPDGLLLFTLEHLAGGGDNRHYRLAPTGRFSHSADYVRATLANAGLVDVITDPIIPRLECGEPVYGLLVIARSSPRKTTNQSRCQPLG
jgi:predicted TPR repeat methyltransferase